MSLFDGLMANLPIVAGVAALGVGGALYMRGQGGGAQSGGFGGSSKKTIDVLQPRDKRAFTLPVIEGEIGLQGPKRDGVQWRFYKAGAGYNYPNGAIKFWALEGSAYTAVLKGDQKVELKLPAALEIIWGKEAYAKMPPALKEPLETHQFGVTIYPEKIPDDDKAGALRAANVEDETDQKALGYFAKIMDKAKKFDLMTILPWVGVGVLVGLVLAMTHIVPIAPA